MESSKCPRCGDDPHFIAHVDKWYCFGCNSYLGEAEEETMEESVAPEAAHVEPEKPSTIISPAAKGQKTIECRNCGAELQDLKDGRLYCFMCETYQDEIKESHVENEAQALVDHASEQAAPAQPQVAKAPEPVAEVKPPVPAPAPAAPSAQPAIPATPAAPVAPVIVAPPKPQFVRMCTACGQPLKYIDKYQRFYCYGCKKYAPKDQKLRGIPEVKKCPECGGDLRFIEKYNEHYCNSCKKYPLRAASRPEVLSCQKCGAPLKWVEKYARHYCYTCKEYAPKGFGGSGASSAAGKKVCPGCNEPMKYVAEYDEWYCYKCRKYSLRPSKPALFM